MLNLSKIAQELDFEEEDVIMLIEMFKESANDSMIALIEAIEKNDYKEIKHNSHSIKGSAANIMLNDIVFLAKEIESAAIQQESIDYHAKYRQLYNALQNINIEEVA
jgi:HPt (histidine-containing phosphotransfer) domain-containing protein